MTLVRDIKAQIKLTQELIKETDYLIKRCEKRIDRIVEFANKQKDDLWVSFYAKDIKRNEKYIKELKEEMKEYAEEVAELLEELKKEVEL